LLSGKSLFMRSAGWRPQLMNGWAEGAVRLAREISPGLVRSYGAAVNAFAGYRVARALGLPHVVSLHMNPAEMRGMTGSRMEWLHRNASRAMEEEVLRTATLVLPVYQGLVPYLESIGCHNYQVSYNALNGARLVPKTDYAAHDLLKILCVGRQVTGKNPEMILRAVAVAPHAHLTLVGDGALHDRLREIARELGAESKTTFISSMPNDQLCAVLRDFDVFMAQCDSDGIPKAVMEPMLVGLPVVVNRRTPTPVAELPGDVCMLVDDTAEGYAEAIRLLGSDEARRTRLGKAASSYANARWSPTAAEERLASVNKKFLIAHSD
jgi:glycosyltransferase involved in cell wall biosynthesis